MDNNRDSNNVFVEYIIKIIYKVLRKEKILQSEYRLGKVDTIISPTQLKVFIDGSTTSVTCACNPDVTFSVGDNVFVLFINNNTNNRFVLCKRAV